VEISKLGIHAYVYTTHRYVLNAKMLWVHVVDYL